MRRITVTIVSTISAVVLLFSYRTSTRGAALAASAAGDNRPGIVSSPAPAGSGDPGGAAASSAPATSAPPRPGGGSLVVNGTVIDTPYGPVQVQAHIGNGRITDVVPLRLTSGDRRDEEINSYAVPQLHQEVLQAQSANVDVVSGATYTSEGYLRSLQAALDTAHFH